MVARHHNYSGVEWIILWSKRGKRGGKKRKSKRHRQRYARNVLRNAAEANAKMTDMIEEATTVFLWCDAERCTNRRTSTNVAYPRFCDECIESGTRVTQEVESEDGDSSNGSSAEVTEPRVHRCDFAGKRKTNSTR